MWIPRLAGLFALLGDWLAPKCGNGVRRLERIGKQQYERLERRGQIGYATHKRRLGRYIVLGLLAGYFYGMFLNSVQLGTAATFHTSGAEVESIWVFNPFRNWFILFTPFGLGVTAVLVLLVCLITKKGYIFFWMITSLNAYGQILTGTSHYFIGLAMLCLQIFQPTQTIL